MTEYDILPGRSSANAKRALELAEKRGFPRHLVRTITSGYMIPLKQEEPIVLPQEQPAPPRRGPGRPRKTPKDKE